MTKINKIRNYFKDNPNASQRDALRSLASEGITDNLLRVCSARDVKNGFAEKIYLDKEANDWTLDYSKHFQEVEVQAEMTEWKKEIQMRLIEQLLQATEQETNSEKIRLNVKTIAQLLKEV